MLRACAFGQFCQSFHKGCARAPVAFAVRWMEEFRGGWKGGIYGANGTDDTSMRNRTTA